MNTFLNFLFRVSDDYTTLTNETQHPFVTRESIDAVGANKRQYELLNFTRKDATQNKKLHRKLDIYYS